MSEATPFPALRNDSLLRAARGLVTARTPVWVMRQAGRYLPEFREVRAQTDFFTVCRTPELAAEVTLQPLRRFDLDAAIIFCDILVIPQALGMEVLMVPGTGPKFPSPLETPEDLGKLDASNLLDTLQYVFDAITLTRHKLEGKVPLIGFTGAPWTLMAYMIEGQGSKTFSKAKKWLYRYPEASHKLMRILTDACVVYLVQQAHAGAQLLKVFDSWAGELCKEQFEEFLLPYLVEISVRVKEQLQADGLDVPMILFAKGIRQGFSSLASQSQYDVLALDWCTSPTDVRSEVDGVQPGAGHRVCLQGNLDPCALYAEPDTIVREVRRVLESFDGNHQPHIFNLGHGMHPTHDPAAMKVLVDAVHAESEKLRANA